MNDAAKEALREYYRQWRAKNPEKVKQYQENYWSRKAEQMKEVQHNEPEQGTDNDN